MDIVTLHRRAVEDWQAKVDAVADGDWGNPTTCSDWTVRDLVNHVVGEELWLVPLLGGATINEVGDRFEAYIRETFQ